MCCKKCAISVHIVYMNEFIVFNVRHEEEVVMVEEIQLLRSKGVQVEYIQDNMGLVEDSIYTSWLVTDET